MITQTTDPTPAREQPEEKVQLYFGQNVSSTFLKMKSCFSKCVNSMYVFEFLAFWMLS